MFFGLQRVLCGAQQLQTLLHVLFQRTFIIIETELPPEIIVHVEFISDSEANFFTAKVYRQEHAPIKPADAPVSCPINSPDCPINPNAEEMSDTAIRLLETIKANPGIGKKTISTVSGLSVRNIKFHIEHSLRGKVEFRGAKKTGGYYIVAESKTQRTKAKKRKQ